MFDSNGQTCNRMCTCEYTYFFYIRNRAGCESYSTDHMYVYSWSLSDCFSSFNCCSLESSSLTTFSLYTNNLSTKLSIASPTVIL